MNLLSNFAGFVSKITIGILIAVGLISGAHVASTTTPVIAPVATTSIESVSNHPPIIKAKPEAVSIPAAETSSANVTASTTTSLVNPNASFMEVHGGATGTPTVEPTKPYMAPEVCEGNYTLSGYGCVPPYNY